MGQADFPSKFSVDVVREMINVENFPPQHYPECEHLANWYTDDEMFEALDMAFGVK